MSRAWMPALFAACLLLATADAKGLSAEELRRQGGGQTADGNSRGEDAASSASGGGGSMGTLTGTTGTFGRSGGSTLGGTSSSLGGGSGSNVMGGTSTLSGGFGSSAGGTPSATSGEFGMLTGGGTMTTRGGSFGTTASSSANTMTTQGGGFGMTTGGGSSGNTMTTRGGSFGTTTSGGTAGTSGNTMTTRGGSFGTTTSGGTAGTSGNTMTTQGGSFGSSSGGSAGTMSTARGGTFGTSTGGDVSSSSARTTGTTGTSGTSSGGTTTPNAGSFSGTTGTTGSTGGTSSGGASSSSSGKTTTTLGGTFSSSGGQATGTFSAPGTASPSGTSSSSDTSSSGKSPTGTLVGTWGSTPSSPGSTTGKADVASPSPDTSSPSPDTSSTSPSPPLSGSVTSQQGGSPTSTQCGIDGNPSCAGGNSDPVMYGFAGRSFNFIGDVGKTYNIISTQNLQVSMKLKLARMWDHNGTNMEAIGLMYRTYKALIALNEKDELTVSLQGRQLKPKKNEQHHAWHFEDGAYVETSWDQYKPGLGNTVVILTDVLKMTIWQTPAGIVDEGGVVLPSWLNFGITLLGPPANGIMHGIVGGTYDRYLEGESAVSKPESQLYLPPDDSFHGHFDQSQYEMKDFWDTDFAVSLFGVEQDQLRERSSLETEAAFPAFARACWQCSATPSGQGHTF